MRTLVALRANESLASLATAEDSRNRGRMSLAATLLTEFNDEAYRADLASVVGPRSVEGLAAWLDELCRVQLAERVVRARFACKSVGAVFGLVLTDGRGVVLKLFPASIDAAALHAIVSTTIRSPSISKKLSDLIGHHDPREVREWRRGLAGKKSASIGYVSHTLT